MKAPDKIYLSVGKGEDWAYAMWTTKSPEEQKFSELDDHEEYIRKNALIEWIEEQLAILDKQTLLHPDDDVFLGQRNAYKQMKDKLNSL